jgi:hypothetical protein
MNIGNTINFFLIIIFHPIGKLLVITPEDKDLNFAVENQRGISKFTLHDKVNRKGDDKDQKVKI